MQTHNTPDVAGLDRQATRRASVTGARVLMGLAAVGALGAGGVALVDGILTGGILAAYLLSQGWRAWSFTPLQAHQLPGCSHQAPDTHYLP